MLHALKLVLPAIIPSWNFFDVIVPSPRIEYLLMSNKSGSGEWCEFRPRLEKLSLWQMLGRMIWNAQWNESLFLVSCSERLLEYPTSHSEEEIFKRLIKTTQSNKLEPSKKYIKFRLLFIRREDSQLVEDIRYQSKARLIQSKA